MSLVHALSLIALNTAKRTCPPCELDDREGAPANSLRCAPCAIARAWIEYDSGDNFGGPYQYDCINAMSVALGEGAKPGSPLKYITKFCPHGDDKWCWKGPGGKAMTLAEFITDTRIFNLDQLPYDVADNPDTVGPWQTRTADMNAGSDPKKGADAINKRISEAIGYAQSCCMDGDVTTELHSKTSENKWCPNTGGGNCKNEEDGKCSNPNNAEPISVVHSKSYAPLDGDEPVLWCGCKNGGKQTTGYSGRCSHHQDDFYTRYDELSWNICHHAARVIEGEKRRSLAHSALFAGENPYTRAGPI